MYDCGALRYLAYRGDDVNAFLGVFKRLSWRMAKKKSTWKTEEGSDQ